MRKKIKSASVGSWSTNLRKRRGKLVKKLTKATKKLKLNILRRAKSSKRTIRFLKRLEKLERIAWRQIKKNRDFLKPLAFVSSGLILFSAAAPGLVNWLQNTGYEINARANEFILDEPDQYYGVYLQLNERGDAYAYNEFYDPGSSNTLGAKPEFQAEFPLDPTAGFSVTDPVNNVSVTLKPNFPLKAPIQEENRLIYPLVGVAGAKVLTLSGAQVKEDIILDSYQGDDMDFSYELEMPDGVEARLEVDGSLSFYGVNIALLGDVAASSPEDQKLLADARQNGAKTNLLFRIPAPVVLEEKKKPSVASTWYELDGNTLTLKATGLSEANYPLSLDPSIYIETARKLMRGNNETNIDFDINNELIKKGFTTGARFDTWNNTMNLNDGRWNQGTAVAGGFIYAVGGEKSASTSTTYSTAGATTYVVPAGVTSVTVKIWGAGGGGGGGGTNSSGFGGAGGGGGYVSSTLAVTPAESLDVYVGAAGGAGDFSTGTAGSASGDGGGGGGRSYIERTGTPLMIAAGGAGGGGGDNSSATDGGGGGAGGGTTGQGGSASSSAPGGGAGSTGSGGSGGNGSENDGAAGGSEFGGDGADGRTTEGADGSKNNGGNPNGGDGGNGDEANAGFAGGGAGGDGYYGGGGGSSSIASNAGGGGGGGGSSYTTGTSTTNTGGSGSVPGNDTDGSRAGAGNGGTGGLSSASGTAGTDGIVIISYTGTGSGPRKDVYWAQLSTADNSIESPNPGAGVCTNWCTDSSYDLPDERVGFSMVAYNGFLYVIGGENTAGTRQSTVYIAKLGVNGEPSLWHPTDSNKNNWVYWYSSANTLTNATSYSSAVAYNNRLYLLGGQTNTSTGGVNTVYVADFNPTGDIQAWSTTGMTTLPSVRQGQSVQVYNDYMYLIGGNSNGTLQDTVYYNKIDRDGTLNTWTSTTSFATARSTWGGTNSVIWGGYLYLAGGCSAVNGSGYCTTIQSDIQLASINADGSLDKFDTVAGVTNQRIGYGFVAWDNALYRIGGCGGQNATTGECDSPINDEDYAVINQDGDASTVSISEANGVGNCSGGSPFDCDLPPAGDDAGEGGQMLSMSVAINGFLYVIGGCVDYTCDGSNPQPTGVSGNVSYAVINTDGSLGRPATCIDSYYGAWCVDSTNRINGTTGVAAAGVTVFDETIYIVGGLEDGGGNDNTNEIYRNTVNADGSLSGAWTTQSLTGAGASDVAYTYVYSRANPASVGTNPGNLFIFGGCSSTSGTGCNGSYITNVYKCNIGTSGAVSGCTTSGQLQIDSNPGAGGNQGLGIHSGTVYANYIYLVGGYGPNGDSDKDDVYYAQFNDSNNVVAVSGSAWIESPNKLAIGRRRGWAFGYNGYIYSVGGYDDTGGGTIIPDIEFAKVDVSDGSISSFTTSAVTINQRWGLSMVISNSYAYVIGGCDVGSSPNGCSSFEPSVQTFQIYNNDSGTAAGYGVSDNLFATDRYGSSSVIYNGYLYVAGGCTNAANDCDPTTNNVQYASLDAEGDVGTWSSTSMNLPQSRGWGQLEEAGGSLYYVGGQDSGGDEKPDVYYATPETTGAAQDVFRTTTYKLNSTEFSNATYTLALNNNLEENYFVMIAGAGSAATTQGSNQGQARVDGDPFGNLGTTTSSNEILLSRGGSTNNWVGTVTVVECQAACGTDGFQLTEVVDQALVQGSANTPQTTTVTLNENHTGNTVPFGGYLGGGLESTDASGNDYAVTAGVRIRKATTNQIDIERYGGEGFIPEAADITIYVVDWGSNWNIQEVNFDNWNVGGSGVNATGEYTTQAITSVTRDDTWLWKSPGTSETGGLGDGALGKVLTLGDGVNQNTSETTVALGSYRVSANRDDTVYVMEHANLASDYRFRVQANLGTSFTETVDGATGSETYNTTGNVSTVEGYRVPLFYYTDNGTGQAYPRVGGWSNYYTATGTITADKAYSGNNQAGWWQSVDFAGITYTPTDGDLAKWNTASNGLPADRTQFGMASWNDRIYVVAGLDDTASETNTVYVSPDLSAGGDITSAWTSDADVPDVVRSGNTVVAYANNLYSFSGYDGTNYLLDSQFTQINSDGSLDAWTFTTNLPSAIRQGDGFAANGYMYVVGGRTGTAVCDSNTLVTPISANTTIATGNNPTGVGEWYETNEKYAGDRYGASIAYNQGKMYLTGGQCNSTLTGANRTLQTTLLSQPQVARYSRLIDTDTDVFPNKFLLNGLDNSIGARWEVKYSSSTDANSTWGQETDFGGVTLGTVNNYTPLDETGTNTNSARFIYFWIEIDSTYTFGYPEDLNRGPTIDDITLFFTSDPGKRLRHGKTFTGGEKQPLDTPPPP